MATVVYWQKWQNTRKGRLPGVSSKATPTRKGEKENDSLHSLNSSETGGQNCQRSVAGRRNFSRLSYTELAILQARIQLVMSSLPLPAPHCSSGSMKNHTLYTVSLINEAVRKHNDWNWQNDEKTNSWYFTMSQWMNGPITAWVGGFIFLGLQFHICKME